MHSLRKALACAALIFIPLSALMAQTSAAKKKPSATKKGGTAARKTAGKKRPTASATPAVRRTWRNRQLQPSEQRYKEIQTALASKGYLHGQPTGTWNQESIDAMRHFQEDQKLEPTGKIDSLSLIALGLGPKHETAKVTPPVANPQADPPQAGN
jgi:hypothetical protein